MIARRIHSAIAIDAQTRGGQDSCAFPLSQLRLGALLLSCP